MLRKWFDWKLRFTHGTSSLQCSCFIACFGALSSSSMKLLKWIVQECMWSLSIRNTKGTCGIAWSKIASLLTPTKNEGLTYTEWASVNYSWRTDFCFHVLICSRLASLYFTYRYQKFMIWQNILARKVF